MLAKPFINYGSVLNANSNDQSILDRIDNAMHGEKSNEIENSQNKEENAKTTTKTKGISHIYFLYDN